MAALHSLGPSPRCASGSAFRAEFGPPGRCGCGSTEVVHGFPVGDRRKKAGGGTHPVTNPVPPSSSYGNPLMSLDAAALEPSKSLSFSSVYSQMHKKTKIFKLIIGHHQPSSVTCWSTVTILRRDAGHSISADQPLRLQTPPVRRLKAAGSCSIPLL